LTNVAGKTLAMFNTVINVPLVNQGTIVAQDAGNALTSSLTAAPGSTLRVEGNASCCSGVLTIASGFTNNGVIELTSFNGGTLSALVVTSGTLVNAPGGTISVLAGTGGSRQLSAALNNQGTLDVGFGLTLTYPTTTSGTIALSAGTLTVGATTSFTYTGGTIGGLGALSIASGGTLNLATSLSTAGLNLSLANASVSGAGTLTNVAGQSLSLFNTVIAVPLVNQGTIIAQNAGNTITALLTTTVGSVIRVEGNASCCAGSLTVANGFTNLGAIELTTFNGGTNALFAVTSGTLVNAPGGTISILAGTGGTRQLSAALDNQGTLNVGFALTLTNPTTTSGTIDLSAGTLVVGAATSFTYTGGTIGGLGTLAVASGGTLTLAANLTTANLNLALSGATVSGTGTLTNVASQSLALNNTVVNVPFVNQGTIVVQNASNAFTGAFTTAAASTLRIQGNASCCSGALTVASGFTNNGLIELSSFNGGTLAALTVTSGTLLNAAGGTISVLGGTGGSRQINAAIDNQGTMDIGTALLLTYPTTTTGTVALNAGTLTIGSSAPFTFSGGTIGGAGTLAVASGGALTLGTNLTTANLNLSLNSATVTGSGTLTNVPGQSLLLNNTTIAVPFVNQGTIVARDFGSVVTGAFTSAAGSTLRVEGNASCCSGQLTIANGFTNNGRIELTTFNGGSLSALTLSAGTLTNAAGGTIAVLAGTGGSRQINAPLNNQGALEVEIGMTLTQQLTTSGTVALTSGTLTIAAQTPFTFNGGSMGGPGTLTAATGATLTLASNLSTANLNLSLNGATVSGTGTLTNPVGQTLTLVGTTINVPVVNQGTIIAKNPSNALNAALTTATGSLIRIEGNASCCAGELTVGSSFTNNGRIEMTTINGGSTSSLALSSGTLTNAASGTIAMLDGTGGTRQLLAPLNNQGTLDVGYDLTLSRSLTTTGSITIASGQSLVVTAANPFIYAGGTMSGAGTIVTATSATLTLNANLSTASTNLSLAGGIVNGSGTLTNATGQTLTMAGTQIDLPVINQGSLLVVNSGNALNGAVSTVSGSLLRVQGNASCCVANLTLASGFSNNGTIELTSINGGQTASLSVSSGTLTNAAGGTLSVLAGTGGSRIVNAIVNNQGTIAVSPGSTSTLDINGGLTTSGIINLELSSISAFDRIQVTGALSLGGTLNVSLLGTPPSAGQTFTVLTSTGATSNSFGTLNLPAAMIAQYGSNSVTLQQQ
jgi:fibronectin-binding autotransporter adhesin